jgi:hypothetical protein
VLEIRANRFAGSESLLWYAVHDQKLWIRMRAIMGLADIGQNVTIGQVKKALGKDPDARIANFFTRFVKNSTEGERYVMRHAIRLVGERSRFVILKSLEQSDDEMRNMYMAAASLDSGPHIKSWLRKNRIIFDMNGSQYEKYIAMIAKPGTNKSIAAQASDTISPGESMPVEGEPNLTPEPEQGMANLESGSPEQKASSPSTAVDPGPALETEVVNEAAPDAEPATEEPSNIESNDVDASFDDF